MKAKSLSILLIILILAFMLRFYRLDSNPPGLFKDEVVLGDMAYDLVKGCLGSFCTQSSLVFYGHDTYVPPLQVYSTALSILVFGFSEFAVRLVPAVLGVLIVLSSFVLGRFLFNDSVGLLASAFVAISPFHIVYSRLGFSQFFLMTLLFTIGIYLFFLGLGKRDSILLVSALSFGLTFLSYYLSHIFIPLSLLGFYCLYYRELKQVGRWIILPSFIILLGFFVSVAVPNPGLIVVPVPPATFSDLASNLAEGLSSIILMKGNWYWPLNSIDFGIAYPVILLFSIIGVFLLLKNGDSKSLILVYWFALALVLGLSTSSPVVGSVRRAFTCAGPVVELIAAYGVYRILSSLKNRSALLLVSGLIALSLILGLFQFLQVYFVEMPRSIEVQKVFMTPIKEVFNYTESVRDEYDLIVFTSNFDTTLWPNSSLSFEDYRIFYTKRFSDGKYALEGSNNSGQKVLYIVRDFELANRTPEKTFHYSNGDVAYFAVI